jgi:hypothetical protein
MDEDWRSALADVNTEDAAPPADVNTEDAAPPADVPPETPEA